MILSKHNFVKQNQMSCGHLVEIAASGRIKCLNSFEKFATTTWEIYSQWSSIDLADKNIDGGEMNTLSLGLNWSPTPSIQFNTNYRYSTLDRFEQTGSNHGIVTRLVLTW